MGVLFRASPFAVRLVGAALTAASAVIAARLYGAVGSGEIFYLVSSISLASLVTRLGVDGVLTRTALRSRGEALRVACGSSVAVAVLVAVMAVFLMLGSLALATELSNARGGLRIWTFCMAVMSVNLVWIAGAFYRSQGAVEKSIAFETGLPPVMVIAGVTVDQTFAGGGSYATSIAAAYGLSGAVVLASVLAKSQWRQELLSLRFKTLRRRLHELLRFSPAALTNGLVVLAPMQTLGWLGAMEAAGIYNALLRVSMLIGAFGVVIRSTTVRDTKRAGAHPSRQRDLLAMAKWFAFWSSVALAIGWNHRWLETVFGPEFGAVQRDLLLTMLCVQCLYMAGVVIETRVLLLGRAGILAATSAATAAAAVAANGSLTTALGLTGAVLAFAGTVVVNRAVLSGMFWSCPYETSFTGHERGKSCG